MVWITPSRSAAYQAGPQFCLQSYLWPLTSALLLINGTAWESTVWTRGLANGVGSPPTFTWAQHFSSSRAHSRIFIGLSFEFSKKGRYKKESGSRGPAYLPPPPTRVCASQVDGWLSDPRAYRFTISYQHRVSQAQDGPISAGHARAYNQYQRSNCATDKQSECISFLK